VEATAGHVTGDAVAVQQALSELGLSTHAAELDALGFTIVPPETAAPAGFVERVRERLLDMAARRDGERPDTTNGATHENKRLPSYHYILFEDEIFEELLMMPTALALVTRLLGWSCVLNTSTALVKGTTARSGDGLDIPLHSDNEMHPPPFPAVSQYANATWLLSDYTASGGALCFVPGSHVLCRQPWSGEALDQIVPVEAPLGSLVVWHSNTWHGALRRREKGLRIGLSFLFGRKYLLAREPYREDVTKEMLDRHPARFATLMGKDIVAGWRSEGPDYSRVSTASTPTPYS
jgi:hypothetical protein